MGTPQQIKDKYEVSQFDCQAATIVMGDEPQIVIRYAFYSTDGAQLNVIDALPTYTPGQFQALLVILTTVQQSTDDTFEALGWTQK